MSSHKSTQHSRLPAGKEDVMPISGEEEAMLKRNTKPSKYKHMIDPPIASAPHQLSVDPDKCIGCGVCTRQCPSQTIAMVKRKAISALQQAACQHNCLAGTNIKEFVRMLADGASNENAWETITRANPFPAVTGRVCPHPCESNCNRGYLDTPLNIHSLERSLGDYAIEKGLAFKKPVAQKKESVAVIGSGPAGMSCAYQLALKGYPVTVFEQSAKAGGMLTHAIPRFRLPDRVVDSEIKRIADLGITIKLNTTVGKDITIAELKEQYQAVFVGIGAQNGTPMGIEGEKHESVVSGLTLLRSAKEGKPLTIGKRVFVVGGGNTAIDVARTARRQGSEVTILYRRTEEEMPARPEEVAAAREEGIDIEFLCTPLRVSGSTKELTCQRMTLGDPDESGRRQPMVIAGSEFQLTYDTVIVAVGQNLRDCGVGSFKHNAQWLAANAMGHTKDQQIFAGGDAVDGPSMVSQSITAGRKAALAIDAFLQGEQVVLSKMTEITFKGIPLTGAHHLESSAPFTTRNEAPMLPAATRVADGDAEEISAFTQEQVASECSRCLGCGDYQAKFVGNAYFGDYCIACHNCDCICPQGAMSMLSYFRVDEGRFTTPLHYPANPKNGLPNPLGLPEPLPFAEIEAKLTETEKVIYKRRSTRVFKSDPVPREMIKRILESGRFAPTAGNCQGFKFVVITDRKLMDELNRYTLNFLGTFSKLWTKDNPLIKLAKRLLCLIYPNATDPRPMQVVANLFKPQFGKEMHTFFDAPCAIMVFPHDLHVSDPEIGVGIVCQNMVLAAHSLGLGTCYVGFVANALNKDRKTRKRFAKTLGMEWPFVEAGMILLIGYPAVQTDGVVSREFPPVTWIEPEPS